MCLGIACEVVEVEDRDSCLLRIGSSVQRCFTGLVDPVAPGDWLLMHAGFALQRITPEEAAANLALLHRAAVLQEEAHRRDRLGDHDAVAGESGAPPRDGLDLDRALDRSGAAGPSRPAPGRNGDPEGGS